MYSTLREGEELVEEIDEYMRRFGGNAVECCLELSQLSASLLLPSCTGHTANPCHHLMSSQNLDKTTSTLPTLSSIDTMATSARFVSSLRRTALSSRAPPRFQCLRPASQLRWNSTPTPTSATSEPHQPDAEGGVKGKAAPAKTIQFTSESCVTRIRTS